VRIGFEAPPDVPIFRSELRTENAKSQPDCHSALTMSLRPSDTRLEV
jgi:sRNA-binding carbon storage regulator CsrA